MNSTLLIWIQKLEIESQFMNFTCTLCIVDLTPLGVKTLARSRTTTTIHIVHRAVTYVYYDNRDVTTFVCDLY